MTIEFGPLALVVAAGLFGPLVASTHRLAPPIVIGEIAAGVALGNSWLGWIDPADPFLSGLATVGFALLMFVVGTHLPMRDRRLLVALGPGVGIAVTVGVMAVVAAVLVAPHVGFDRPGILAVLFATSSAAVAVPVLQSLDQSDRAVLATMVWIAIADVSTVAALPVVLATGSIARVLIGGLLVVAAGAAMFVAARRFRDQPAVLSVRQMSHDRGWGLDLRISLLALFGCAWLATRFGASILIAGFTVGIVVAMLGQPRRVADQLIGLGEGFAIPLFFVVLGAELDLGALLGSPAAMRLAAVLAVVAVAVHLIAAVVWRLPLASGLVASAQLGVPAALVAVGLSTGQLTPAQGAAVMASVLATLAAFTAGAALFGRTGR